MSRGIQLALGATVLGIVLLTTDVGAVAAAIAHANLWLVALGLGGLVGVHVIPALAWRRMVVSSSGVRIGRREAIRLYYAGQALGGITPANLGGDVYRVAALKRSGTTVGAATVPIAVQRGTSFLALATIGLVGLAASSSHGGVAAAVGIAALAAVLIGLGSLLLMTPPTWLRNRLGGRLDALVPATDGRTSRDVAAVGVASGLAFHAVAILATWLVLVGTSPMLAAPAVLAAVAAARLSLAMPIAPSGIGIGEGVLAALVAASGGPVAAAVAGMLVARLALVATTAIGAALIARGDRRRLDVEEGARPTTSTRVAHAGD